MLIVATSPKQHRLAWIHPIKYFAAPSGISLKPPFSLLTDRRSWESAECYKCVSNDDATWRTKNIWLNPLQELALLDLIACVNLPSDSQSVVSVQKRNRFSWLSPIFYKYCPMKLNWLKHVRKCSSVRALSKRKCQLGSRNLYLPSSLSGLRYYSFKACNGWFCALTSALDSLQ